MENDNISQIPPLQPPTLPLNVTHYIMVIDADTQVHGDNGTGDYGMEVTKLVHSDYGT